MRIDTEHNIIEHGSEYSVPVNVEGYPRKSMDKDGNWKIEEKFLVHADHVTDYLPSRGDVKEGLSLNSVETTYGRSGFPNLTETTVVWKDEDLGDWNGSGNRREITCRSTCRYEEKKIEEHPKWEKLDKVEKDTLKTYCPTWLGVVLNFVVTERKRKANFRWTSEQLKGNVNQRMNPPYLKDPEPLCWKCVGREISWTKGESVEIVDTYAYDRYQWANTPQAFSSLDDLKAIIEKYNSTPVKTDTAKK